MTQSTPYTTFILRGEEQNREEEMVRKITRRGKSWRKCKEEGENEMLGVGRYRLGGNFIAFFNLRDDKG